MTIHTIAVQDALNFLAKEEMVIALPPVTSKFRGAQDRHMYALTPKGQFHISTMS